MGDQDGDANHELAAGNFSSWLSGLQIALRGQAVSDVPCGGCTACCRSSQFVHIGPDENETLARIPSELLFPAPGRAKGHVVMGYDEHGHCPMLVDGGCSVYENRPRTCRTYDCRVFPAGGLDPGHDDKPLVADRTQRWRFTFATEADRNRHAAVRAASAFLREHDGDLAGGIVPSSPTQLAVLAVEIHDLFLQVDHDTGRTAVVSPLPELVRSEILARTRPLGAS